MASVSPSDDFRELLKSRRARTTPEQAGLRYGDEPPGAGPGRLYGGAGISLARCAQPPRQLDVGARRRFHRPTNEDA
jgi:hypothetical protein